MYHKTVAISTTLAKIVKSAPASPGVYIFKRGGTAVYIGKAGNLKKRLGSYFRANAGPKVRALRTEATAIEWQETGSEIEALIREAELIKRHLPKYNVLLRDDKSYYYAAFTAEKFPRVLVVHKTHLAGKRFFRVIGPFTNGSALFGTLKLLRRIFPYCTCKQSHKRPCVNAQIRRCLGFCCGKNNFQFPILNSQNYYRTNIKNVIAVLSGKRERILSRLKREMREASQKHEFESAARLRDQIAGIKNIFSHRHILEDDGRARKQTLQYGGILRWKRTEQEIRNILGGKGKIVRVEGYDISHISGTAATGSMVVFINGRPVKSLYRKFKIKTVRQAHDLAMHQEVMRRRLAHEEWGMPDLIVIDGGLPQLHAIAAVLRPGNSRIRLAALAKREEELYIEGSARPVRLALLSRDAMLFFQYVRDESHRFAKKYHHQLRAMSYRNV